MSKARKYSHSVLEVIMHLAPASTRSQIRRHASSICRESFCAAVVGILLLVGKLNFKKLLPWAMVLANTYGQQSSLQALASLMHVPFSLISRLAVYEPVAASWVCLIHCQ